MGLFEIEDDQDIFDTAHYSAKIQRKKNRRTLVKSILSGAMVIAILLLAGL